MEAYSGEQRTAHITSEASFTFQLCIDLQPPRDPIPVEIEVRGEINDNVCDALDDVRDRDGGRDNGGGLSCDEGGSREWHGGLEGGAQGEQGEQQGPIMHAQLRHLAVEVDEAEVCEALMEVRLPRQVWTDPPSSLTYRCIYN